MKFIIHTSFILTICLVLTNCQSLHQNAKPYIPVKKVTLERLEAKELSENYKTLSSKKDEIILFAYYLKSDSLLIENWYEENLSFTENKKIHPLDTSIVFSDVVDSKLVFILIELDTRSSASEMDRIFQSNFRLLNGISANRTALQLLLGDDDLLDIKVIKLNKLSTQDNNQIQFSGVHLFDEYEYILQCKFE